MEPKSRLQNPPYPGSSVSEYGLIGALVVLVCIGVFVSMGGNLNQILADLKSDMREQSDQAVETEHTVAVMHTPNPNSDFSNNTQNAMNALMKEFTPAEQALLQQDLSGKLQTAGANGTTALLSRQMAKMAAQLLKEGKISAEESGLLMRLANQGHRIAEVERLVEEAVRLSGGDAQKLREMTFQYKGQPYTALRLAATIGFNGAAPDNFTVGNMLNGIGQSQPEIGQMLNLYLQVEQSGLLKNNPEIQGMVNKSVSDIARIGESVESVVSTTITSNKPLAGMEDFNNQMISNATDVRAGTICQSGNFSDDGRTCR